MATNVKFENPFILSGYRGPDFFCDRQDETSTIFNELRSGNNLTIYGRSRIGKTALVYHVLNTLQIKNQYFDHLFVDLFLTNSLQGLVQKLVSALLQKSGLNHKKWSPNLLELMRSIGASITFDPVSDSPQVHIDINSKSDAEVALQSLLEYLDGDRKPWIVILDKMHRLLEKGSNYIEQLLYHFIDQYPKVRFVFVTNEEPEVLSKFIERKHNFLKSTQLIAVQPINGAAYLPFIQRHFENGDKKIEAEAIQYIYSVMRAQTYAIQLLCNRLYDNYNRVGIEEVRGKLQDILDEEQAVFSQINRLITSTQWKLLMAIASEDIVRQPLSSGFVKKYDLTSPSTVQTALKALVKKSLVYTGEAYEVQDVIFARWLKRIAEYR